MQRANSFLNQIDNCIQTWTSAMHNPHSRFNCRIHEAHEALLICLWTFIKSEIVITRCRSRFSLVYLQFRFRNFRIYARLTVAADAIYRFRRDIAWSANKTNIFYFHFRRNLCCASFTTFELCAPDARSRHSSQVCCCSTQSYSLPSSWTSTSKTSTRRKLRRRRRSSEKLTRTVLYINLVLDAIFNWGKINWMFCCRYINKRLSIKTLSLMFASTRACCSCSVLLPGVPNCIWILS